MISVIIPAYNAENVIKDCLISLLSQNYPKNNYEIIVVDDGSSDKTKEIVKNFKNVRLIEQNHKGPAAARNLGVRKSKGDIILFTDADCVPSKNWIKFMTEPFKDKTIVGVSGTYRTLNKNSLIARFAGYEIEERHEKMKYEKTIDFIGTFSAAYRKNIFIKFGGFDENFPIASGEDTEFSFKISEKKLKMVFEPRAYVYHRHPDTLIKYLKQKFWRGYWRILLYKKHTKKLVKHSYTPRRLFIEIILTGVTLLFFLLTILKIISFIFPLASFLILLLTTIPLSIKIAKKDFQVAFVSPFILILRNIALCLGILYGIPILFKKMR